MHISIQEKMGVNEPEYGYYHGDIRDLISEKFYDEMSKKIDDAKLKSLVGFIGGQPCPDFSVWGENKGENGENGILTQYYIYYINVSA